MENKKLPISREFLAALLFTISLFNNGMTVAIALVVLLVSSDEWLKKMIVRLLAMMFTFALLSAANGMFIEIIDLLRLKVSVPYAVTTVVNNVVQIAEYLCMFLMAWNAYKGRVFTFGFLEKIVEKVYQRDNGGSASAYCMKCGTLLSADDSFCQKCGTKRL